MSRLTASPFHKPTFEFPRVPLSPPETNVEVTGPTNTPASSSVTGAHDLRPVDVELAGAPTAGLESAGARFRRVSSIAYHSSGLREPRERVNQRSPKAFIIVIPPATLTQEHGQLGHTLSTGPRHRLSQGLLMPLFPTMYGQLTAIAREFNFPSTTGLCLYYHIAEDGIIMTPRISDETWQFIWSPIFDASTPAPPSKSLINGKIEFDIDVRQARWYASWIASSHRDYVEPPFSLNASTTPSLAHYRGESKTTFIDDPTDDQGIAHPVAKQHSISAPTARHVPRKLSLVDRYDVMSTRSASRPASRSALTPPEPIQMSSQILSPIVQEEEPKSAMHDLDSRVKSWRASAHLKPTPLAATGQTSLEPAKMPNILPIDDAPASTPDDDLNLADFDWSISSMGPGEYDPISPISWDRVPSVHIANRMQGSVCMTPSDCTSFGPSDYTLPSPMHSLYRLPSPDLAHRMYEDIPPTPSTATSWGPLLSYPPSPQTYSRPPSVGLAERFIISRPVTPSTATSWGPGSWPVSPVSEYRPRSIHLGDRGDYSRPVTPSTATSWGAPLSYPPSPTSPFYVQTPDVGQRGSDVENIYRSQQQHTPWVHTWPYIKLIQVANDDPDDSRQEISTYHPLVYPHLEIYRAVYPFFDLYPALADTSYDGEGYPHFNLYPHVTPTPQKGHKTKSSPNYNCIGYPHFDLYPPVHQGPEEEVALLATITDAKYHLVNYPNFDLYPPVYQLSPELNPTQSYVKARSETCDYFTPTGYPYFNIYPAVAPNILGVEPELAKLPIIVKLPAHYPIFDIYPAIYPENLTEIYPSTTVLDHSAIIVSISPVYPTFNLYPAVYPHVTPYLQTSADIQCYQVPEYQKATGYPDFNLYPSSKFVEVVRSIERSVRSHPYPVFDIYPALYPAFNLYPWVERPPIHRRGGIDQNSGYPVFELYPILDKQDDDDVSSKTLSVRVQSSYPNFDLYPAVYPACEVYPALPYVTTEPERTNPWSHFYPPSNKPVEEVRTIEPSVRSHPYPVFDIYPALYPAFNLYPCVEHSPIHRHRGIDQKSGYPVFELYPILEIQDNDDVSLKALSVRVQPSYPNFDLYPAVYPTLEVYPALPYINTEPIRTTPGCRDSSSNSGREEGSKISSQIHINSWLIHYPNFNLYPSVYPHFDLYPSIITEERDRSIKMNIDVQYPVFNLYPAIYPYFDLWPMTQPRMAPIPKPSSRLTHSELHAMVMMERVGSTGSFGSTNSGIEIFNNLPDFHDTGSFVPVSNTNGRLYPADRNLGDHLKARSRQPGLRSNIIGLPPRPSPGSSRQPPSSTSRLTSAFETLPTSTFDSGNPSPRASAKPLPQSMSPLRTTAGRRSNLILNRSTSIGNSSLPNRAEHDKLDRSQSLSTVSRPSPRRRDSIVSQRVKSYNSSTAQDDNTILSMETLSKFPAPPLPTVPVVTRVPKALDRSKYPFA